MKSRRKSLFITVIMFGFITPLITAAPVQAETEEDKLAKYYDKVVQRAIKRRKSNPFEALTPEQTASLACSVGETRDPKPVHRTTPPAHLAIKNGVSGQCSFKFDIDETGLLENIKFTSCSAINIATPSANELLKWVFAPKCENGVAVKYYDDESRFTFKVYDERGREIPIPEAPAK